MSLASENYARSARARVDSSAPVAARVTWITLLALTLFAAVLRAVHLSFTHFWTDEYATYVFATEPIARLFGPDYRAETNPPLYYLLQRAWLWVGDSPGAMRTLPILWGLCTVPLTFLLGRPLVGEAAALIGAALVATSTLHIHHSREVRGYTLLTAASLGALVCLTRVLLRVHQRERWLWVGYVVCSAIALYTHSTAILLPVLCTALVAGVWVARRGDRKLFGQWFIAHAILLVLAVPHLSAVLQQSGEQLANFWVPRSTPGWVYSQLLGAYPFPKWSKPFFFVTIGLGILTLRRQPLALACLLVFLVGQPLLLFIASLFRPMFLTRTLVWPTPLAFLLIGAGLMSLRPQIGRLNLCLATVLACALQLHALEREIPDQPEVAPMAEFVDPLRAFRPGRDVLVFAPLQFAWHLWYEARDLDLPRSGFGVTYADEPVQLPQWYGAKHVNRDALSAQLGAARRVWIVLERAPLFPQPEAAGFTRTMLALRAWGEPIKTWHAGPLDLVLLARREPSNQRKNGN